MSALQLTAQMATVAGLSILAALHVSALLSERAEVPRLQPITGVGELPSRVRSVLFKSPRLRLVSPCRRGQVSIGNRGLDGFLRACKEYFEALGEAELLLAAATDADERRALQQYVASFSRWEESLVRRASSLSIFP